MNGAAARVSGPAPNAGGGRRSERAWRRCCTVRGRLGRREGEGSGLVRPSSWRGAAPRRQTESTVTRPSVCWWGGYCIAAVAAQESTRPPRGPPHLAHGVLCATPPLSHTTRAPSSFIAVAHRIPRDWLCAVFIVMLRRARLRYADPAH